MMRSSRDNSSASSIQGQINGVVTLGEIEAKESSGFKDWKSHVWKRAFVCVCVVTLHCQLVSAHSVMSDSATPWTAAHQARLSMEFSRQEYWSGEPFPTPEDLPDPGIELVSPALAGGFFTTEPLGNSYKLWTTYEIYSLIFLCLYRSVSVYSYM